jgi:glucan 1,3-beta-glucosidase
VSVILTVVQYREFARMILFPSRKAGEHILAFAAVFAMLLPVTAVHAADALPFVTALGSQFADDRGEPLTLKGCNLGNYLMLESWMFGKTLGAGPSHMFRDGVTLDKILRGRFGDEKAAHLIELYRNGWITPRDFEIIKSFGFNCVRLPFDYRLIQADEPPFNIRPDAFRWLDHAVNMAREAGVYVILDLHGTPGGQSLEDHTGEAGQDHLWTSDEDQKRTVELWRAVAAHFKDQNVIAAYDLINEPYGNHTEDCRPVLSRLLPQIYRAIRLTGDQHVVFFSGGLNTGIAFYGNPHDLGMQNVAFTEHYYPGLFGGTPSLESQARVLNQLFPIKHQYLRRIASPYYVGEFNVVLDVEDPPRLMRAYYDRFAEYGWAGTMWAYKLISAKGSVGTDAWYMVTNAAPLPTLDLNDSPYQEVESFFASLATMPLATNDRLRSAMTASNPPHLYLASFPALPTAVPSDPPASELAGYASLDVGGATPGYTRAEGDGTVLVMAGGQDIFGAHDAFRFVSRPETSSVSDERATILSLLDSAEHAKAGVMARWSDGDRPDSAMAVVNVFPDGSVALMTRAEAGTKSKETRIAAGVQFPVELRLQISEGHATAMYRTDSGEWQTIGSARVPRDAGFRTGLAVCAHSDTALTVARARLEQGADESLPPSGEDEHRLAGDRPLANWSSLEPPANRELTLTSARANSSEVTYNHAQVDSTDSSVLSQDVNVEPGKRYLFSIFAQRIAPAAAKTEAHSIELRLQSVTEDGEVTLNSRTFQVRQLPTGKQWQRLSVSGTADAPRLRIEVVVTPSVDGPRDGSIKLHDAALGIVSER